MVPTLGERGTDQEMRIGIPKEIYPGERRVAATPMTVAKMRKLGLEVLVQAGAGEGSDYADGLYIETGATVVPDAASSGTRRTSCSRCVHRRRTARATRTTRWIC